MPRLRRLGALLFLPLCFQLGLAARAIACVNDHAGGSSMSMDDGGSMPGMNMPAPSSAPNGSDHHGNKPCDGPFNPGDCQPFAACAPAVLAPTPLVVSGSASIPSNTATLVVLTPSSWTVRPALPPPRV
jgi:hypothetical protein